MLIKTQRELELFSNWLALCGAEVFTPYTDFELLRVRVSGAIMIAHRNRHGGQVWPTPLAELYRAFVSGAHMPRLAETPGGRKLTSTTHKSRVQTLARRDGWQCWYCGIGLRPSWTAGPEERQVATLEELCPRQIGGPNHISNQALCCKSCNERAGSLSVVEKGEIARALAPRSH